LKQKKAEKVNMLVNDVAKYLVVPYGLLPLLSVAYSVRFQWQ